VIVRNSSEAANGDRRKKIVPGRGQEELNGGVVCTVQQQQHPVSRMICRGLNSKLKK